MREKIGNFEVFTETMEAMGGDGLLLVAGTKGNPMTIGWGTIGIIWGLPVFAVLVRPSRYTFKFMEEHPEFIVNVPDSSMKKQVAFCGAKSGRHLDKVKECGFTMVKGEHVSVPYIEECPIHYECRTIHRNNVLNPELAPEIVRKYYPAGDFHRLYYGEILGVYRKG